MILRRFTKHFVDQTGLVSFNTSTIFRCLTFHILRPLATGQLQ